VTKADSSEARNNAALAISSTSAILPSGTDLTIANASQHLQHLRRFGLVEARREGKRVIYRLADPEVVALLGALSRVTQRNVGAVEKVLNSYFRERDNLEPVSRKELFRRMRDGLVTLIDTRPEEEFSAGHLPGAINLPLSELKRRLRELPRDQEIVAYCRGPYCVLSYEAVAELRRRGFKARVEGSRSARGTLRESLNADLRCLVLKPHFIFRT
jgi:rhodanese-related sulfurtransferase/DNA-binding transcriptional ArsR family regulator